MDEAAFRAQMEEEERRRAATVQADLRQMAEEAAGKRSSYAEEVTQTDQAVGEAIGRTADSAAGLSEQAADFSRQDEEERERLARERQELEREREALQRRKQQLDEENDRLRRERERAAKDRGKEPDNNTRRGKARPVQKRDEERDSDDAARRESARASRKRDRNRDEERESDDVRRERARAVRRREEDEDDLRSRRRLGTQVGDQERTDGTRVDPARGDREERQVRNQAHADPARGDREERQVRNQAHADPARGDRKDRQEEERRKKKKNPAVRFLRVLLVILLAGILLLCAAYYRMHGSIRLSQVKEKIAEQVAKDTTLTGYTIIALFGVDSIENSLDKGNNRSDVMIILSINNATKEAKLVSVYRDTYLDIGDGKYTKANAAYAYGGPTQAVTMLNQNFDLDIEDYATIGFGGVADIIDALGGIDIDIKEDEIHYMNDYQSTMAQELGKTYVPVQAAGTQTLTGLQAVSYCRVRYTAGGDFTRTERQRTVLTQTFSKLKTASAAQMVSIATKLLSEGEVQTSLSMTEIASLASGATQYSIGDSTGVPTESLRTDAYVGKQDCIIPVTLADNVVWLHEYLFGESGYQVSDTVQTISDQIRANTGY